VVVAAGLSSPSDHAVVSLFALNGLRVSEAIGVDIDNLGLGRGHRTLTVLRKSGKTVTMPLAPRVARAIDLAIGERTTGPVFLGADSHRLDLTPPAGSCVGSPAEPGSSSGSARTPWRHAFITAALDAGVPDQ
jgi:integrase/recombinase XerD